jgi:hypothetical protein
MDHVSIQILWRDTPTNDVFGTCASWLKGVGRKRLDVLTGPVETLRGQHAGRNRSVSRRIVASSAWSNDAISVSPCMFIVAYQLDGLARDVGIATRNRLDLHNHRQLAFMRHGECVPQPRYAH